VCELPVAHPPTPPGGQSVDLHAVPRPDESSGGSNIHLSDEDPKCLVVTLQGSGTAQLQYLDQRLAPTSLGNLVVLKATVPSPDVTTEFGFTVNGPTPQPPGADTLPQTFSLRDGDSNGFAVTPGTTYSVAETLPANWQLTDAKCDNGSGTLGSGGLTNISVAA